MKLHNISCYLFGLLLYVSQQLWSCWSPDHTFFWASLTKQLKENVSLHESMGPNRYQTQEPWIWSQPHYRLRYGARSINIYSEPS